MMDVMPTGNRKGLTESGVTLASLLRAHRLLLDEVDEALRREAGLSFPLWEVLATLSLAPEERLRMVDLTKAMCVSKSNVTQLVDKLAEQGLVARETSTADRRLVYAALTERGRETVDRGTEIFNRAAEDQFAAFMTRTEADKLASGLSKIISALDPESTTVVPTR